MNEGLPRHLDLFSGIGGFSLAFEAEGFRTIGFSEIDPYACAVLKKHWPNVPNFGDVRNIPHTVCDVLTGGFPCQPFSGAGRKLGAADNRNEWPTMLNAIDRIKPTYVIGENVINFANMVLSRCQDDLAGIGYESIPFDILACAVGLPTMERHIWIVAALPGHELERNSQEIISRAARLAEWNQGGAGHESLSRLSNLSEPALYRSRKGLPGYVDRIRCLGNAVPVQVAQIFARAIYREITD